jgi:hypothetical protein
MNTVTALPEFNVSKRFVSFTLSQSDRNGLLTVFNLLGKAVASIDCSALKAGTHSIPISAIPSGSYVVELRRGKENVQSRCIVE